MMMLPVGPPVVAETVVRCRDPSFAVEPRPGDLTEPACGGR
jgi:hypothetical protein